MSEVGVVDDPITKTIARQRERLEILAIVSVIPILAAALWHIWPGMTGDAEFLPLFGPAIILMVLALAMQDFVDYGPRHRSRLAAMGAIAWAPLVMMGMGFIDTDSAATVRLGYALMGVVGIASYSFMTGVLTASLTAVRFRGLVQMVGATSAVALLISADRGGITLYASLAICSAAIIVALYDTLGRDPDREARKKFKQRRTSLELRILELRADGVQVDQASSLLQNATEVGYTDPAEGMVIIAQAEDDIERILAFSSDISAILEDSRESVERADDIAPTTRRAKRLLSQGEREMELGSLRDAEMLFRKAKQHSSEIIEFWNQAEQAITDAKRALSGTEGLQYEPLKRAVEEAEEAMRREECAEAIGLVLAIPDHVENLSLSGDESEQAIAEAKLAIEAAKGIDDSDFLQRIKSAEQALEEGDYSRARGMADSLMREVRREADSMLEVQKAWRQRKKLVARWQDWADGDEYDKRLKEVDKARKAKLWSHAAKLLAEITDDLDRQAATSGETEELLNFLRDEWRGLRNRLEAANIKVGDDERSQCEGVIGEAVTALQNGDIETCLAKLGDADARMEALRRRV